MSKQYTWAANPQKLVRAIGLAKGADETEVKRHYIEIGGLLINEEIKDMDPIQENEVGVKAPVEETVATEQTSDEVQVEEATETKIEETPVEETVATE